MIIGVGFIPYVVTPFFCAANPILLVKVATLGSFGEVLVQPFGEGLGLSSSWPRHVKGGASARLGLGLGKKFDPKLKRTPLNP